MRWAGSAIAWTLNDDSTAMMRSVRIIVRCVKCGKRLHAIDRKPREGALA